VSTCLGFMGKTKRLPPALQLTSADEASSRCFPYAPAASEETVSKKGDRG
jgi:hypothetical protein